MMPTTEGVSNPSESNRHLADRHRHMLEMESRISPERIADRGYWTAETNEELIAAGMSRNQLYAPAVVVPTYGVSGAYQYSRVRPDNPPPDTGKYIQPAGTPNVLDVPRAVLEQVTDSAEPLAITEGERKVDYLASLGIAAVCIFGVWNWSHKTDKGTPYELQLLLPDFDSIPLRDREVSILFDCDTAINRNIQMAACRLAKKLRERGAKLW